jgi:hypothetical protein
VQGLGLLRARACAGEWEARAGQLPPAPPESPPPPPRGTGPSPCILQRDRIKQTNVHTHTRHTLTCTLLLAKSALHNSLSTASKAHTAAPSPVLILRAFCVLVARAFSRPPCCLACFAASCSLPRLRRLILSAPGGAHDTRYTARYALHCTIRATLHDTRYTARYPLHCTIRATLHDTRYAARYPLHCTIPATLHDTRYAARYPLHCTLRATPLLGGGCP